MSVAYDNQASKYNGGYDVSQTISAFQCNGTDSHLVVATYNRVDAELTGVTANGNAMAARGGSFNSSVCGVKAWDYTISNASFDVVASTPSYKLSAVSAIALSGVHQTTAATGTPVTAGAYNTTATASYTGTSGNMLLVFVNCQNARTLTASNCTQIHNFDHTDANLGQCFAGYVAATGSSQTIGCTLNTDDNWRLTIVEVASSGGSPSVTSVGWFNGSSWVTKPLNIIT